MKEAAGERDFLQRVPFPGPLSPKTPIWRPAEVALTGHPSQ
jgi:hypothetical protein